MTHRTSSISSQSTEGQSKISREGRGKTNRISRLLKLALFALERRQFDVPALVEKLGVSRRTIFRDIADLYDAGFELHYNSTEKTYRLGRIELD
ncbi:MAG: HTH domain-containing protein [Planctomycetaceae bacterium]